eukprot:scaffold102236_cov67-Phaeocystis_antarctica.AAC.5
MAMPWLPHPRTATAHIREISSRSGRVTWVHRVSCVAKSLRVQRALRPPRRSEVSEVVIVERCGADADCRERLG